MVTIFIRPTPLESENGRVESRRGRFPNIDSLMFWKN